MLQGCIAGLKWFLVCRMETYRADDAITLVGDDYQRLSKTRS